MKTIVAKESVVSMENSTAKLIACVRQLCRRIAYQGENIVIYDGLDDVRHYLEQALECLEEVEDDLDGTIDAGFNELEEDDL